MTTWLMKANLCLQICLWHSNNQTILITTQNCIQIIVSACVCINFNYFKEKHIFPIYYTYINFCITQVCYMVVFTIAQYIIPVYPKNRTIQVTYVLIKIHLVIYTGYLLMKTIGILRSILNVNFYFRNYVSDNEIQLCSFLQL